MGKHSSHSFLDASIPLGHVGQFNFATASATSRANTPPSKTCTLHSLSFATRTAALTLSNLQPSITRVDPIQVFRIGTEQIHLRIYYLLEERF